MDLEEIINIKSKSLESDDSSVEKFVSKIDSGNEYNDNTRYQYPYVEMEEVLTNPSEYIIPQCLPACKSLWAKNIETFMVSNNDDDNLYVLLTNVSPKNIEIFNKASKSDPRFIFSTFRNAIGIAVKGTTDFSMEELDALTDIFVLQDTTRFLSITDFLEKYKMTDGKMVIENDGTIRREQNPALENSTLQEALEKTGKEHLYVVEEGRVYDSQLFLDWHKRYQNSLQEEMKDQLSYITPIKDNMNGTISYLRDVFLNSEREYVTELLKEEPIKRIIEDINQKPTNVLFMMAQKLIDQIDAGEISDEQMDFVEKKLIILLASIQDKVLTKDLVLLPNESHGMSR